MSNETMNDLISEVNDEKNSEMVIGYNRLNNY